MDDSRVTVDDVIDYLNELVELDHHAIGCLIESRVPCNVELAQHPAAQAVVEERGYGIGLLGILNGLFGTIPEGRRQGWGKITAIVEHDENSDTGHRLVKFRRTSEYLEAE